jgi:hypothetical protein
MYVYVLFCVALLVYSPTINKRCHACMCLLHGLDLLLINTFTAAFVGDEIEH